MGQQQLPLLQLVDFVDRQDNRALYPLELLQHHLIGTGPRQLIHHEDHHIHVDQGGRRRLVHIAVQGPGLILMHARCIDINGLYRALGLDAQNLMPGGLRLP